MRGRHTERLAGRLAAFAAGVGLAAAMLGALPPPASAQTATGVRGGEWYAEAVIGLAQRGIVFLDDEGAFHPDDPVTRGELALYLDSLLDLPDSTLVPFTDVSGSEPYAGAVAALYQAGLTSGTSVTTYSPDAPVSRQQAATFVMRALSYSIAQVPQPEGDLALPADEVERWLAGFRDRLLIAPGHAPFVANACRLGIMQGALDGWFYPALTVTRAQIAQVLYRAFLQPLEASHVYPVELPALSTYPAQAKGSTGALVSFLEARLTALHYPCGEVDGVYDQRTRDAVMAFEKVEGLPRDGTAGPEVWQRVFTAQIPAPRLALAGDRVEVDLSRQVLFLIKAGDVAEIVHVSTGRLGTPTGHGAVWLKQRDWVECSVGWMYFPSYFWPHIAVHGSSSVPPYPASHGCIRTPVWIAEHIYNEIPKGTPVDVYY